MDFLNGDWRQALAPLRVRLPAVAGTFYPGDAAGLRQNVAALLGDLPATRGSQPKALIVPHAGYVYSGPVAATGYRLLAPWSQQVRRVVLLGPAHRVALRGFALPGARFFRTPLGDVPVDPSLSSTLVQQPLVQVMDGAHALEHSLEVHLPFLQALLPSFSLLPVVVGTANAAEVASLLQQVWGGPETLIVVSTDLSHYLPYDLASARDAQTCAAITGFQEHRIGPEDACGCVPLSGLLREARRRSMSIESLDVRNSGDTAGPRDRVVGYAAFVLREAGGERAHNGDGDNLADRRLVGIARDSIEQGLAGGVPALPDTDGLAAGLRVPAAAFVTLQLAGRLRGCIGTLEPIAPLAHAVADAAFKSAFRDPRFPPLTEREWPDVDLSISILGAREPLMFSSDQDLVQQLRPGTDGLVIASGRRSATFLPSVWDTLPAAEDFLRQLREKAGIPHGQALTGAWRYTARYLSGSTPG